MNEPSNKPVIQKPAPPGILKCLESDTWKQQVTNALPNFVKVEVMLRIARSVASDFKFSQCDPKSFLIALCKCARAGLIPDGQHAHLIPFGKEVQAIFDWKGIAALASRNGITVTPKLVFREDEFFVEEDDGSGKTKVVHRVNFRKPRGEVVLVYSRAVYANGQIDYEFMTTDEVEEVRKHFSRAKDKPDNPWNTSFGEMMKKTCIKRHSKRWDLTPETRQAINADDDPVIPTQATVTSPLFQPKAIQEAASAVSPTAEPNGEGDPPQTETVDLAKSARDLCRKSKVKETEMCGFLMEIGVLGEDQITDFDAMNEKHPDVLATLVNQFDDMAEKLKQAE